MNNNDGLIYPTDAASMVAEHTFFENLQFDRDARKRAQSEAFSIITLCAQSGNAEAVFDKDGNPTQAALKASLTHHLKSKANGDEDLDIDIFKGSFITMDDADRLSNGLLDFVHTSVGGHPLPPAVVEGNKLLMRPRQLVPFLLEVFEQFREALVVIPKIGEKLAEAFCPSYLTNEVYELDREVSYTTLTQSFEAAMRRFGRENYSRSTRYLLASTELTVLKGKGLEAYMRQWNGYGIPDHALKAITNPVDWLMAQVHEGKKPGKAWETFCRIYNHVRVLSSKVPTMGLRGDLHAGGANSQKLLLRTTDQLRNYITNAHNFINMHERYADLLSDPEFRTGEKVKSLKLPPINWGRLLAEYSMVDKKPMVKNPFMAKIYQGDTPAVVNMLTDEPVGHEPEDVDYYNLPSILREMIGDRPNVETMAYVESFAKGACRIFDNGHGFCRVFAKKIEGLVDSSKAQAADRKEFWTGLITNFPYGGGEVLFPSIIRDKNRSVQVATERGWSRIMNPLVFAEMPSFTTAMCRLCDAALLYGTAIETNGKVLSAVHDECEIDGNDIEEFNAGSGRASNKVYSEDVFDTGRKQQLVKEDGSAEIYDFS